MVINLKFYFYLGRFNFCDLILNRRYLIRLLLYLGRSLFNLLNNEDLILMIFFMERELSSLSEGFVATFILALKRFLASVNECVFSQILTKSKSPKTNNTLERSLFLMSLNMSSQRISRCKGLSQLSNLQLYILFMSLSRKMYFFYIYY